MTKLLMIVTTFCLLISCQQSDMELNDESNTPEGVPVTISLSLDKQQMSTRSGLSSAQEREIKSLFVLVFNKTGTKVSQSYISSNIASSLSNIRTRSGTNMSLFIIANLSSLNTGFSSAANVFNNISTIEALNATNIYNLGSDVNVNRNLIMYGTVVGLTLAPNESKGITVPMSYVASRVTLYVVKDLALPTDSYTLTDWEVQNYPTRSFILPQTTDAVNPGTPSDYSNSITSKAWVDTTILVGGVLKPAKYAFLYTFENRRAGRKSGSPTDTDQRNKAKYAPDGATAIVMHGHYQTGGALVTTLATKIYLGANNYADYNLYRGHDYTYIVTIKGISEVAIDSRIESSGFGFQTNLFHPTMDCHPDRRPLQILSWPATVSVGAYEMDGTTPCTWLRLSKKDLNRAVLNARITYNPVVDMTANISLNFPTLPTSAIASQIIYLYASENTTDATRNAQVKITSGSQTVSYNVSQLAAQVMGDVGFRSFSTTGSVNESDDYVLAVENIEEASLNLTPGITAGVEALTTMQWGFNQTVAQLTASATIDHYRRNGYTNTMRLVYGNTSGAAGSILRPPYGRLSALTALTASVSTTENLMEPIFNTYPARYCFEKNRDLDGDGFITSRNSAGVNEIQWYLPSTDELNALYVGQYALLNTLSSAKYHCSSELYGSSTSTNSLSYDTGLSGAISKFATANVRCVKRIYTPISASTSNSPYLEGSSKVINNEGYNPIMLRPTPVACPVPMHSNNSVINNQFAVRFQIAKEDCKLNGNSGASQMTWAQANGWTTASNNSTAAGVIAPTATGCQAYSESGGGRGSWRLPTQREMYQMLFLRNELKSNGYTSGISNGTYWSSTYMGATLGWYADIKSATVNYTAKTSLKYVRCVRDRTSGGGNDD